MLDWEVAFEGLPIATKLVPTGDLLFERADDNSYIAFKNDENVNITYVRCAMTKEQIENSIAYCGLVCGLCRPDGGCNCKTDNHCGKRLSPKGCYQYQCCKSKGLNGCWECAEAPCGVDMLAPEKTKLRAFVRCIKEDGIDKFSQYIMKNAENGIVYHRSGIYGDYDLGSEEAILELLRNSVSDSKS